MNPLNRLPPTLQGYIYTLFTMCIWGSFSLLSRLNASWGIHAWDIMAIRFGVSASILITILIYQKNWQFLLQRQAVFLAIIGGIGYNSLVYGAFLVAPVVHGAIFLNGVMPVATAFLMWLFFKQRPNTDTKIALVIIITTLIIITALMLHTGASFGVGDFMFIACAFCWAMYGILMREWKFSAWQIVCSTSIWSAVLYLPLYFLFATPHLSQVSWPHILIQGSFHSIAVMMLATISYALAIERLGAFIAGSIACLAPFIAALVAVPLLGEPLNYIMTLGLIGMGFGTVQPWRFIKFITNRKEL